MSVRAVFFDVGETLVDETRQWSARADWLGVPRLTFFAVLGGLIARGEQHWRVFKVVRPQFDRAAFRAAREAGVLQDRFDLSDFYPDALPCLQALHDAGYVVGVAGNQPEWAEARLRGMELPVDVIASSAAWGSAKPSPEFFGRVVSASGVPASQIAYVGDRLDNDVLPAVAAGMVAVHIRRGPWGYLHAMMPEVSRASLRIDSLSELPAALRELD